VAILPEKNDAIGLLREGVALYACGWLAPSSPAPTGTRLVATFIKKITKDNKKRCNVICYSL